MIVITDVAEGLFMRNQEVINKRLAKVLLIGKSQKEFSQLCKRLWEQGWQCTFAASYPEAVKLLDHQLFDLILSSGQPGVKTLLASITGSSTNLFCAHSIEDSCLWVPVVLNGSECLGAPILRPGEFSERVREIFDTINFSSDRQIEAMHSPGGIC
jgi:hypothetical protein